MVIHCELVTATFTFLQESLAVSALAPSDSNLTSLPSTAAEPLHDTRRKCASTFAPKRPQYR